MPRRAAGLIRSDWLTYA